MIIASRALGTDEKSELNKRLDVAHIHIDAKGERIVVTYDIVLVSPTGLAVSVLETKTYTRHNRQATADKPANLKFNALRDSLIGQGIIELVSSDISNYDGTDKSLEQD